MICDNRKGVANADTEQEDVSLEQARNAVSRLNGAQFTLVYLERADGCQFMIGGGPEKYIVTLDNGQSHKTLLNSKNDEASLVEVCAGGQFGEYPDTLCQEKEKAIEALSLFWNGSETGLDWV